MRKVILFCIGTIFLSGCTGEADTADYLFQNNFDNYADWGFQNASFQKNNAHSGDWYCQIDGGQYSIGFKRKLSELPVKNFKKVLLSAWVNVSSLSAKANLVLAIGMEGQEAAIWEGTRVEDQISEANEWTQITSEVNIPENVNPEYILNVYVWNNGADKIKVDDIAFDLQ